MIILYNITIYISKKSYYLIYKICLVDKFIYLAILYYICTCMIGTWQLDMLMFE